MAARKRRTNTRRKSRQGGRAWLLLPVIILVVLLGWLYRHEIVDLATFRFKGIDFSRPPVEKPGSVKGGERITEKERKELEKILETR